MLISIYGTVYNNARMIKRCLSSLVRALTEFDEKYELVVVDNYSTDGTFEILKEFARRHRNVKLFRAKCSRGKGRDIALKNTSGDYVFRIDFDEVFEREFKLVVDKLKQLCTRGTLWSPYGFSTRDTSVEMIGGWRNLNLGEDWEFVARAIARGVSAKQICIPPFSLTEKVKLREMRYAKGFSYRKRKIRNIIDAIRGCNLDFNFFKNTLVAGKIFTPSSTLALALYPFSKALAFKYDRKLNNIEFVYKNRSLLFPEDVGLPENWFIIMWGSARYTWPIVEKKVKELIKRDGKLKVLFKDDKLICARNLDLAEKYF